MADPFQVYTALVVGASAVLMLSVTAVAYLHVRSLSDDVLRSRMYLKSHLVRRGYFIFVVASVGLLFLGVPFILGMPVPWAYVLTATVVALGGLDLAVLTLYSIVAPREHPLAQTLDRLSHLLRRLHDRDSGAEDR